MSSALYEKVQETQYAVNSEHAYKSDASGYGIGDFWDIMSAGESGDCEDFALTKMQELINYGVAAKHLQLMLCEVVTGAHHAVLAIQTSNHGTLILDNRYDTVLQIGNVPYRFYAFQNAGVDWKSYTARLVDVPIEYMSCHAAAFADGDQVVVEFTGQDFSQPKVIGFKENPAGCAFGIMIFQGAWASPWGELYGFYYDREADSFTKTAILSDYDGPNQNAAAASPDNGKTSFYLGGNSGGYRSDPADWELETDTNRAYTKATDSWQTKKEMIDPKQYHTAYGIGGNIYEYGGYGGNPLSPTLQSSNHQYIPESDIWSTKTNIGIRYIHGAAAIGNLGYILGGFSGLLWSSTLDSLNSYDAIGDAWESLTGYGLPIAYPNFFADLATGKGYVAGGVTLGKWGSGKEINTTPQACLTERCYEYDPVTNSWSRMADSLTHGCEGRYYEGADPPGWYIDPDNCQDRAGYGFYNTPHFGGVDSCVVFQKAVSRAGGYYHVMPTCEYKPSTNVWAGKQGYPERWLPFYLLDGGCACHG